MKYPYIGNWKTIKTTVMFTSPNSGFEIEGENKYMNNWSECRYENITTEYLANTYGEVKSKAHAEFIVKLAEVNKVVVCDVYRDSHKFFAVIDSSLLFFNSGAIAMKDGRKQITIPLPPECESEGEWPKVNDEAVLAGEVGIVKLPADAQDYYIVEVNGLYKQCRFGELSKPKTPEQIMQENLINIYESSLDGGHFVDNLLSKYTLTKKPQ